MMTFIYILAAIIVLIVVLALIAPKKYHVNRSIVIQKPLPEVYDYLKFIKNQDYWSPWKKKDPNMKQTTVGVDGEIGFINKWEGNKEVGSGEQELTRLVENDIVESQLRFFKPWKSESDAYIKVNRIDENNTEVVWGFSGVNKIPANIFMLFFDMDKAVGKDFDQGLTSLKEILENKG
ncbi:MAG: SRPBCC family protein [Gelidibacter sp.]